MDNITPHKNITIYLNMNDPDFNTWEGKLHLNDVQIVVATGPTWMSVMDNLLKDINEKGELDEE